MSKEITLEQLAATAKGNDARPNKVKTPESPANGAKKMTPSEVAESLTKAGVMKPNEEVITDAPLVDNAFKSMSKTLEERKKWISETMMPIVEENAREMALEAELGEEGEPEFVDGEESSTINTNIPDPVVDFNFEDGESLSKDDVEESDDLFNELDDEEDPYNGPAQEFEHQQNIEAQAERKYIFEGKEEEQSKETIVEEQPVVETPEPVKEAAPEPVEEPKKNSDKSSRLVVNEQFQEEGSLDELMKDLDLEDSMNVVDDEDETPEEIREKFKETLKEVKITSDPIDFNKFKIRKQAVNSNFVLSSLQNSRVVKKADWALYHTKRAVTFLECSGPELDTLRKNIANANGVNGVITSLRFIYDHIEDSNKPSFEQWTKLVRTEDIESMYYGIYRACYSNSNLIARVCSSDTCKKTSLIDTNIDDMVVYGEETDNREEIKAEFKKILNDDTTTENNVFESTLMQISDDIVISYSPATLYSTFIQFATLREEITEKYGDLLNILAYIDGFFTIDRKTMELIPVDIKEYPGNLNKTVLSRLKVFTGILKSLTNDQYNVMTAKLNNIIQNPKITYIYPEVTCPECGATIEQEPVDSMLNLLFTRAQLAQIKSL